MKIKINNIVVEGFRSLATNTEINLDRVGLNLVKGENGAGKTTLFEALVWCIYGTNLKDTNVDKVPTWPETRPDGWRGTYVEVLLSVDGIDRKIVRTINWNGGHGAAKNGLSLSTFVKDGWAQSPGVHKKDVQESIDKLLGLDANTFMNSILFGQRMPKLVESDNADKRDLFEKLFESAFVHNAKAKGNEELQEWIGKEAEEAKNFFAATNTATQKQDDIEERGRVVDSFEATQAQRIDNVKGNIALADAEIAKITEQIKIHQDWVDGWHQAKYDKFQTEHSKFLEDYLVLETAADALYEKMTNATDKHRAAVMDHDRAKNSLAQQKDRDNAWAMNRVEKLANLKDRMKKQIEDMKLEILAVADVCPSCNQTLPEENVNTVKEAIKIRYQKRIDELLVDTQEIKDSIPPPSDEPAMKLKVKETLDAINPARDAQEAAEGLYKGHMDSSKAMDDTNDEYDEAALEWKKALESFQTATEGVALYDAEIIAEQTKVDMLKEQLTFITLEKLPAFDFTIEQLEEQRSAAIKDADHSQAIIDDFNKEMNRLRWWIKTGYSASGLPAFIFESMLDKLNDKVLKYADRLGVAVEFSIDLSMASKPFTTLCSVGNKKGKEYKEFSGGEKQKLDIVLCFAMNDLVAMDADINILILDEIFEGLNEAGEAAVFDLIRVKAEEGKSIYVITHSPHIDSLYSSTLTMNTDETGATNIQ